MIFKHLLKLYVFIIGAVGIFIGIAELLMLLNPPPLGFLLMVITIVFPLAYVLVPVFLWWMEEK